MTKPKLEIKAKPYVIKIRPGASSGVVNVEGPTFLIDNVAINNPEPITCALLGRLGSWVIDTRLSPNEDYYKLPKTDPLRKKFEKRDKEVGDNIARQIMTSTHTINYSKPGYIAFENAFDNLKYIRKFESIAELERLQGKTVLFCGAGPSMNTYKKTIAKAIKNPNVIVIAGGSGIRVMAKWGYRPDYCLAFDPFDINWPNVFENLDKDFIKGTPLISCLSLNCTCLESWISNGGRVLMMGGAEVMSLFGWLTNMPYCTTGLTVSTTAAHLCNTIGASKLVYCGLDMAFGPVGSDVVEYADGTGLHTVQDNGIYHKGYTTRPQWKNESAYFELVLPKMSNTPVERLTTKTCLPVDGMKDVKQLNVVIKNNDVTVSDMQFSVSNVVENAKLMLSWLEESEPLEGKIHIGAMQTFLVHYHLVLNGLLIHTGHYDRSRLKEVVDHYIDRLQKLIEDLKS